MTALDYRPHDVGHAGQLHGRSRVGAETPSSPTLSGLEGDVGGRLGTQSLLLVLQLFRCSLNGHTKAQLRLLLFRVS